MKLSDLMIEIYKYFNVFDQREKMATLTKKELYFLLILCSDNHGDSQTVIDNYKPFKSEMNDILSLQETGTSDIEELKELQIETGDKFISTKLPTSILDMYSIELSVIIV